jgi:hypothetical protein
VEQPRGRAFLVKGTLRSEVVSKDNQFRPSLEFPALHNEVGPAPPLCTTLRTPCAYIRTRDFLIHSAPDSSLFCDAPPRVRQWGQSFPFLFFFFPNDLFSDWFSPFIVHLCSFSKFSSIALVKNFYFRSLIPRHVFYPYASHWSTTPLASHSSTTRAVKRSSSSSHQSSSLRFLHTFVYVHLYVESV